MMHRQMVRVHYQILTRLGIRPAAFLHSGVLVVTMGIALCTLLDGRDAVLAPVTILAIFRTTRRMRFRRWKALRLTRIVVARLGYCDA
jgi:hypothetical protein